MTLDEIRTLRRKAEDEINTIIAKLTVDTQTRVTVAPGSGQPLPGGQLTPVRLHCGI